MCFSLSFRFFIELLSNFLSTSSSMFFDVMSFSVPNMSDNNSSFPSPSCFNGSSIDISPFVLFVLLRYINISFSTHLDAYVASFMFFDTLNVFIAFISPIVPIDIKSSISIPVFSNFFDMYTTSLKFLSTSVFFASSSFFSKLSNSFSSSSCDNGGGNVWLPPM